MNRPLRKLRRFVRVAVDQAAVFSGVLALAEHAMHGRLTVLMYHRVLPDELCRKVLFPWLAVPESLFRAQAKTLAARCHIVTLADGLALLKAGDRHDRPLVTITFDDGYADNFRVAAPILKTFGLLATFFVVAGLIGTDGELWYDIAARRWLSATAATLADAVAASGAIPPWVADTKPPMGMWMSFLKRLDPEVRAAVVGRLWEPGPEVERQDFDRLMTPDELRGLRSAGHEIGSHTLTHPLLPQLSDAVLEHELIESRRLIEGWLNEPISGFCYPNGDHDDRVVVATARAGYTHACLTRSGDNQANTDPLRLRRVVMDPSHSCSTKGRFFEPSFRAVISRLHEFRR
ncbi:MAG: polysaccharide deacetylase family protein [Sulfuricaulis sp.]